ncbi:MAG: PVC-type heme-binding CxxCH protein [Planctomycetota bacterium]|jgi:putative membrane-bound dehydrogenase-like protein
MILPARVTPFVSTFTALLLAAAIQLTVTPAAEAQGADGWHRLAIPDAWRKVPGGDLKPIDGYSWYRAVVRVPADWKGEKLTLFVEALDDARATYINGISVGATGTFPPNFRSGLGEKGRYAVPNDLVQAGEFNTVAIRVFQNDPRPNFNVAPPVLLNEVRKQAVRMDGEWQYRPGDDAAWAKASPADFGIDSSKDIAEADLRKLSGFAKIDEVDDVERYVARRQGDNDPLTPKQAEAAFEVPDDLQFQLVLSEPEISQPLFMTWDERGRLWVLEYRQYPDVAGVKMVSRDVYLRSVYDKVPEPPPHGAKGRDRISIHEDTDGDGVYDEHKVFVDGLNIATSVAIGRGGAFVTNPPYLLFYPDTNGDDIPDGDPEVLLEGFGLEDSHSVINSLRFGPDGWLYGAQGSTVSANVKRPGTKDKPIRTMGQQIWRYHPELKRFEVFAEGGGNTFGVEIDEKGRVFSGHNGGNTRGFHYVQGGYYRKGFGKHGPLSNPYSFGYFANMKHHSVPRFTHNFVIYEENVLPDEYRGRLFGVEPLQGQVVMSSFEPFQSSFETKDISRVVKTDDQWFRPVDIKAGPDGCIYVADMYEQRIDHSSHYAGRIDRTNGRIYRLRPKGDALPAAKDFGIAKSGSADLASSLNSPHKWQRQATLRVLGDRKDSSLVPALLKQLKESGGQTALESLWALHLSGGLTDDVAVQTLSHNEPQVRAWTVRLLCDHYQVPAQVARALADLAAQEPYIEVRKQLASSAKRLPAKDALPIIRNLLKYDEDSGDIHQPLLLWWALESKANADGRDLIVELILSDDANWQRPLMKQHLVERLMKRYALAGSRDELLAAAELLKSSPDKASSELLLKGFEEAYKGRSLAGIPDELVNAIAASGGGSTALKLRQGDAAAMQTAAQAVSDPKAKKEDRLQFLEIFGEVRRSEFIPALLAVVSSEKDADLVSAALTSLQAFDDLRVGQQVVARFPSIPAEAKLAAETLLASRSVWATELLKAVDAGKVEADAISDTALRKILLHNNTTISELVDKHWGAVAGASTEQMKSEISRLTGLLGAGSGNPKKGKPLYMQNCGKCHVLFGEGGRIGPDLTAFKRDNQERILANVVNPNLEIREGFENYVVITTDGRVVNGFLADQDSQVVVIRGVDGQNLVFRRDEIDEMRAIPRSVMPEGTLSKLTDQQIRDLFAYLRSSQPVNY